MKRIKLELVYMSNCNLDNELFKGLLKINKTIDGIDDLFIENIMITPIEDGEDE